MYCGMSSREVGREFLMATMSAMRVSDAVCTAGAEAQRRHLHSKPQVALSASWRAEKGVSGGM